MNPANGAKIQDPEKFAASSPTTSVHEPRLLEDTEATRRKAIKMQRLHHFLFALLIITVLSVSFVCSSPNNIHHRNAVPASVQPQTQSPAIEDPSAKEFQDLLESVEPASLHEVLHKHLKEKYQHGVYQEDKTAMEVVHQQNAEVARSLIELAKRQAGSTNGTVATTTPTSTAVVTSTQGTTSTLPPSSTVVAPASTSTAPQATESSTSVRTVPASTPSPSASSQGGSTSTAPTQVVSSTSNVVSASTTTAGPKTTTKDGSTGASSSPTSQGGSSSTPASSTSGPSSTEGSQASSTADSSDSITQTSVYKTTLANGATSTVTSVTVVPGQAGEHSGGSSGSKTNTANASLQTNGGSQKSFGMNIVVGALGFAAVVAL